METEESRFAWLKVHYDLCCEKQSRLEKMYNALLCKPVFDSSHIVVGDVGIDNFRNDFVLQMVEQEIALIRDMALQAEIKLRNCERG